MIAPPPLLPLPIQTRRLVIREYTAADAPAVFENVKDKSYWQYHGAEPPSPAQVESLITWTVQEQKIAPRINYFLAATRKDTGALIGEAVLKLVHIPRRQGEVGFGVAPASWKQGFGTEIAMAMLDAAMNHFRLRRVAAQCTPENKASIRIMQKLGMAREGMFRDLYFARGKWWSTVFYSILEPEYEKIRGVRKT